MTYKEWLRRKTNVNVNKKLKELSSIYSISKCNITKFTGWLEWRSNDNFRWWCSCQEVITANHHAHDISWSSWWSFRHDNCTTMRNVSDQIINLHMLVTWQQFSLQLQHQVTKICNRGIWNVLYCLYWNLSHFILKACTISRSFTTARKVLADSESVTLINWNDCNI